MKKIIRICCKYCNESVCSLISGKHVCKNFNYSKSWKDKIGRDSKNVKWGKKYAGRIKIGR
jgi:hypothetical protein